LSSEESFVEIEGKRIEVEKRGNRFVVRPWRSVATTFREPPVQPPPNSAGPRWIGRRTVAASAEEELLEQLATETRHYEAVQAALNPQRQSTASSSAAAAPATPVVYAEDPVPAEGLDAMD